MEVPLSFITLSMSTPHQQKSFFPSAQLLREGPNHLYTMLSLCHPINKDHFELCPAQQNISSTNTFFSTTTWVAIPAWSQPGFHSVVRPFMRCHLVMASSTELVKACPRCNEPVTFGGGITITNRPFGLCSKTPFRLYSGLKNPCFSHQLYHAASTYCGLYESGMGHFVSFFVPGGVFSVKEYRGITFSHTFTQRFSMTLRYYPDHSLSPSWFNLFNTTHLMQLKLLLTTVMFKTADIALIGLAVMGQNLILNMNDHGFVVCAYNRTTEKVDQFLANEAKGTKVIGAHSLEDMVAKLKKPRRVMMLVKAGQAVDDFIVKLVPLLEKGDIIIDGGNSEYQDSQRRCKQ
ncbi:6-phosphogluconate dehydrogenase, decarboxylating [Gryllus bimaculatus]|nr:6-phosphogluconate dehydrogenase, decarboxylating [Gryllus bimaculatus]